MSKAIFAEDVTVKIGNRTVLSDINMSVERGAICAVCGGEDSGKEYLKNMLLRQYGDKYKLTGKLTVDGMETELLREDDMRYARMLSIGVLPKEIKADASKYMTGKAYITIPFGEKIAKGKKEILIDAKRLLDIMQIKNPDTLLRKRTGSMNKKELRAIYYAAVLATSPAVLISYGPEDGMSEGETDELLRLVIKICKIKNTALLILTESADFAERYCEEIYFLNNGKLTPAEENRAEYDRFKENESKLTIKKTAAEDEVLYQATNVTLQKKGGSIMNASLRGGEITAVYSSNTNVAAKILCGNQKPFTGEISSNGQDICKIKKRERGVFRVWENIADSFPSGKSVKEVVSCFAGTGKKADRSLAVFNAITLSGLGAGKSDLQAEELSMLSGMKLGIACAVAADSRVLIISGIEKLKKLSQNDILESVAAVCEAKKVCAIIVSSDREIVEAISPAKAE